MSLPEIIYLAPIAWTSLFQRPQHLMGHLSKSCKVLYVETPVDIATFIAKPIKWNRLRRAGENLYIYTPVVMMQDKKNDKLTRRNYGLVGKAITKIIQKLNFSNPLLMLGSPILSTLVDFIPHSYLAYDCIDDFCEFFKDPVLKEMTKKKEQDLLSECDFALFTSEELFSKKSKLTSAPFIIRNAADYEHFSKKPSFTPSELKKLSGPIIGFYGAIYDWVDIDLIYETARIHPEWNFVLIGPRKKSIAAVKQPENVFFLGKKSYTELPAYLHHFDVCILPFKQTELTVSVNPVKIYEYLSAGKPVVSTYLPEVEKMGDVVTVTKTLKEFSEAIATQLISNNNAHKQKLKQEFARSNDWTYRAEEIKRIIIEYCKSR